MLMISLSIQVLPNLLPNLSKLSHKSFLLRTLVLNTIFWAWKLFLRSMVSFSVNRIRDLLEQTCMDESKIVHTPLSTTEALVLNDNSHAADATEYRHVTGALLYLSLARPYISYAVNKLSRFIHSPLSLHWAATKRVLRYLMRTM
ncbi:hypothetical protein PanWU01x14_147410 [Parasponia andersonii]|uniref:Uncharacterized protein n=1 Tax=Parasponia andersonii TaxID=3476 RepID=A0A2P5CJC3_PARAD|nr:hypothetical protein PanWU01x14_147410 [Parasponia andersonii]